MNGILVPQVDINEAKRFSQVWENNGIAFVFDDVHLKFAADFANVCLRSAFQMVANQIMQAQAQAKQAEEKKSIILEGE